MAGLTHRYSGATLSVMPAPANDFASILADPECRAGIDFNRTALSVSFDGTQAAVIGERFVHLLSWDQSGSISHDHS